MTLGSTLLDAAIDKVSSEKITSEEDEQERQQIRGFRGLRNKLLHGDVINLMNKLEIAPTGREFNPKSKERSLLEVKKREEVGYPFKEAILSEGTIKAFDEIRKKATNVIEILDKLLRFLCTRS